MIVAIVAALLALAVRVAAAETADDLEEMIEEAELRGSLTEDGVLDDDEAIAIDDALEDGLAIEDEDSAPVDDLGLARDWLAPTGSGGRRTNPIGRIDVSVVYRRIDSIASGLVHELLLVGTWRR